MKTENEEANVGCEYVIGWTRVNFEGLRLHRKQRFDMFKRWR
jgi:hypothetical protein